jgi:hypothetical protein
VHATIEGADAPRKYAPPPDPAVLPTNVQFLTTGEPLSLKRPPP